MLVFNTPVSTPRLRVQKTRRVAGFSFSKAAGQLL